MSPVINVHGVSKRYGDVAALDNVSLSLEENVIHGLLGRNGAGKTTLMQILTGQNFATSGRVEVFGAHPFENESVLAKICFIKESQRSPDPFKVRHVLRAARMLYPGWDQEFADSLVRDFTCRSGAPSRSSRAACTLRSVSSWVWCPARRSRRRDLPALVSAATGCCPQTAMRLPAGGHEGCPLVVMRSARHDVVCLAASDG